MTKTRAMIVEDEVMVQMHLAKIVEAHGHDLVGTAMDTEEALALASQTRPDIVLMDIHLAGDSDGVETARQLVEEHECAIIFISAYADDQTVERTQCVGAAGYLVKPFTDAQVRAAITTALASHSRLQKERMQARSLGDVLERVGGALFLLDAENRITFANQSAADLVGKPVYRVFGRTVFEVLSVEGNDLHEALQQARATGQSSVSPIDVRDNRGQGSSVRASIESLPDDANGQKGVMLNLFALTPSPKLPPTTESPDHGLRMPFGEGTRLVVYSHDTFGLGHLRRCMAIIRQLCKDHPGISILLVTGSPMVHRYTMPTGADYVKLPALQKTGAESYQARSLQIPSPDIQALRSNLILHTIRDYQPNVLLVDHSPGGGKGELLPTLEWLRDHGGCTRVLGMRDIIDAPETVRDHWNASGIYALLEDDYDHILIYGNKSVYDPVSEYSLPSAVADKTTFVNYICSALDSPDAIPAELQLDQPLVFVTIGGGDGGAGTVIKPFLEMMRMFINEIDFHVVITTGPFVDEQARLEIVSAAEGLPVTLHDFVDSTKPYLERACVTISTVGYNTAIDVLSFAQHAVFIPRSLYRMEQSLRAQQLARLGLATTIPAEELSGQLLFETIKKVRDEPSLDVARRNGLPLDGAQRVSDYFASLQVQQR